MVRQVLNGSIRVKGGERERERARERERIVNNNCVLHY